MVSIVAPARTGRYQRSIAPAIDDPVTRDAISGIAHGCDKVTALSSAPPEGR